MGGSPTSPAPIGAAGPSDGGGEEEDDIASWDDMDQPPIRTDFQSMRKLDDDPQRANIVLEIMKTEEDYINNVEQMIKVRRSYSLFVVLFLRCPYCFGFIGALFVAD